MFLNQASKGDNKLAYYIMTVLSIPLGYFLGSLPIDLAIRWSINKYDDIMPSAIDEFYGGNPDFSLFHIDRNAGLILMILIFTGVWLMLWLSMKFLHKRPFKSLITPLQTINYQKILFSFGFWLLLSIVFESILYAMHPESYTIRFNWSSFIPLFLIGLFILPIQTTAEELVFRGYLLQAIIHFYKAPWFALLITSILFGMIHSANPEIQEYGFVPMQLYYISAGLFLGIITILDDGLELAIGIHAAINFFGAVFSSYEGSVFQTDTILSTSYVNAWVALLVFLVAALIFMLICRKKYQWKPLNALISKDVIS